MVKMLDRLAEQTGIDGFLHRARQLDDTEKWRARQVGGVYEPHTKKGTIISDTKAYTGFFPKAPRRARWCRCRR
jgi:hypothetical protein